MFCGNPFPASSPVSGAQMKSLYDLLGARENDDADALKKSFRRAIKANHPDLNPGDRDAAERFREIIGAHAVLGDAKQRARYDRLLQLEREYFQLMRKRQQRGSTLARKQLRLKRMRATAAAAAVGALISGYWLFAPRLTPINSRQTATVVTAARESAYPLTAIAASKMHGVQGSVEGNVDNAGKPVETTGVKVMAPTDALDQGEPRDRHHGTEVASPCFPYSDDRAILSN
jgi:curved DNA-binding protein CbpA